MTQFKASLLGTVLCLLLIKALTIEHATISGNGNLGILGIIPLVPLALWLGVEWVIWGMAALDSWKKQFTALAAALLILTAGTLRTLSAIQNFKPRFIEQLQELQHEVHPDYVETMTDGLTIFTNTLYFNFTTLLMYLSLCTLLAVMVRLLRKKRT